jgi:hypothetical protein
LKVDGFAKSRPAKVGENKSGKNGKAGEVWRSLAKFSPVVARRILATAGCQVGHVSTNLQLKKLIFSPGENIFARRICEY